MGKFADSTPELASRRPISEPKVSLSPTIYNLGWLTRTPWESGAFCRKIRDNVYFCKGIERGCPTHNQATRIGEVFSPETSHCTAARFADVIDSTRGGFYVVEEQLDQGFKVKRCVRPSLTLSLETILE